MRQATYYSRCCTMLYWTFFSNFEYVPSSLWLPLMVGHTDCMTDVGLYERTASGSAEHRVSAIATLDLRGRRAEEPPRLSSATSYPLEELRRPLLIVFRSSCKRGYQRMPASVHPFCYRLSQPDVDGLATVRTNSTTVGHYSASQRACQHAARC
jgi:hypothetical protein